MSQITIKNTSSRAFILPGVGDVNALLLPPGETKEFELTGPVFKFVTVYTQNGELVLVDGELVEPDSDSALYAQAEELGIKVDKRWSTERLKQEIDNALDK